MDYIRRIADCFYRSRRKLAAGALFLLVFMLGIHVVFGANGFLVYRKKRAEYRALGQEVERIQKENDAMTQRIKSLKTDPATIEKEAREQLRYARPGELVYTYPQPAPRSASPVAAQQR